MKKEILLFLLFFSILSFDQSFADSSKKVRWNPIGISVEVPVGGSKTATAEIVSDEDVDNIKLRVVPELEDFVSVNPEIISLKAGVVTSVTLSFNVGNETEIGYMDGVVQARINTKNNSYKTIANPLSISISAIDKPMDISEVTFFSNIDLPLLLGFRSSTDEFITIAGEKDEDGNVLYINSVLIDTTDGGQYSVEIGEDGKPLKYLLKDGSIIRFDWENDTQAVLTLKLSDGSFQTSIPIDITNDYPIVNVTNLDLGSEYKTTLNEVLYSYADENVYSDILANNNVALQEDLKGTIEVYVDDDAYSPVENASVTARISQAASAFYSVPVKEIGAGIYTANFPYTGDIIDPSLVDSKCQSYLEAVKPYCKVWSKIDVYMQQYACIVLSAEVALFNPIIAPTVLIGCESASLALTQVCAVINYTPTRDACSLLSKIITYQPTSYLRTSVSATKNGVSDHEEKYFYSSEQLVHVDLTLDMNDEDKDGVSDDLDMCLGTPEGTAVDGTGCPSDEDGDGIPNDTDECPGTPSGSEVDITGCPPDLDGDGVLNLFDQCPNTPYGYQVDSLGCPVDEDGDGVRNENDLCLGTPTYLRVDETGCPFDSDNDGVFNGLDLCVDTPEGVAVDTDGCPLDLDHDGVADYLDKCLGTPEGTPVDYEGCTYLGEPPRISALEYNGIYESLSKDDPYVGINSPSFYIELYVSDFDDSVVKYYIDDTGGENTPSLGSFIDILPEYFDGAGLVIPVNTSIDKLQTFYGDGDPDRARDTWHLSAWVADEAGNISNRVALQVEYAYIANISSIQKIICASCSSDQETISQTIDLGPAKPLGWGGDLYIYYFDCYGDCDHTLRTAPKPGSSDWILEYAGADSTYETDWVVFNFYNSSGEYVGGTWYDFSSYFRRWQDELSEEEINSISTIVVRYH